MARNGGNFTRDPEGVVPGRHWIGGEKEGKVYWYSEIDIFWREDIGDDQTHVSVVCSVLLST